MVANIPNCLRKERTFSLVFDIIYGPQYFELSFLIELAHILIQIPKNNSCPRTINTYTLKRTVRINTSHQTTFTSKFYPKRNTFCRPNNLHEYPNIN